MRYTQAFIPTLKEVPTEAQIPSHQLMIRSGLIRSLAAGIYSYLPLGYRSARKVMDIIREEMNAIGGQEFHLPALNPSEIWEQTGRRDVPNFILSVKERELVLAPTHEEIITHHAKGNIRSYKDMPQIWYQIQTKFRNEPRPRSGVLRGRQFTMKDAYSLDSTWEGLDKAYDAHLEAYKKIYSRCGLKFFIVGASSGSMGGSASQEFMIESTHGEDTCVLCDTSSYSANIEVATSAVPPVGRVDHEAAVEEFATPGARTIDDLINNYGIAEERCAKSVVWIVDSKPVLALMSGNDELNESKLQSALKANDLRPATDEELFELTGAHAGSIGPIGLRSPLTVIADLRLRGANGLVSGANKDGFHLRNIDLERDASIGTYADLRTVRPGEPCPTGCGQPLRVTNAIEIGHIFKLGTKYSIALGATFLDEKGESHPIIMGSYGIGVERILACYIEQHHDDKGIIWHPAIAPFDVQLISVGAHKSEEVAQIAESLYDQLQQQGLEVLFDDRDTTPGVKFNDADLIGLPWQLIVGQKNLANGVVELKDRATGERELVPVGEVIETLADRKRAMLK